MLIGCVMRSSARALVIIAAVSTLVAILIVRQLLAELRHDHPLAAALAALVLTPWLGLGVGSLLLRVGWRAERAWRDARMDRARRRDESGRFHRTDRRSRKL